ncbi:hypothetical protein B0H21DRAFT_325550 [Amylocystis lapponica]|nr:hypothetical protein B0H21DRAFT_325550 [Amylocystis lapponica]
MHQQRRRCDVHKRQCDILNPAHAVASDPSSPATTSIILFLHPISALGVFLIFTPPLNPVSPSTFLLYAMGQSGSRGRSQPAASPADLTDSAQPEASSSTQRIDCEGRDTIQTSRTAGPPANKRSRRASLRHSILGLIPHSHSSGSLRTNSSEASSSQPPKKRWRSSRRWSKAPAHLSELPDHPELSHAGPPQGGGFVSVADVPSVAEDLNERPSTDDARSRPRVDSCSGTSPQFGDPASDSSRHPGDEHIDREITEFLENVELPDESTALDAHLAPDLTSNVAASSPEPSRTAAETPPPPARQFPPPGTLVVVQGVVNTTDTPPSLPLPSLSTTSRPSRSAARRPVSAFNPPAPADVSLRRSASTPRTGHHADERYGTRSRLPSFMARPSSMLGRRPSSDGEPRVSQESTGDMSGSSDLSSNVTHDSSAEESSATSQAAENQETSRSETDGRPRPLSPGSIDVLGTLLRYAGHIIGSSVADLLHSVAAAATAASLFSPSLAFSSSANAVGDGANAASQPVGSNRPMSPTPTAGLGSLGGLGGLAGLGLNPASAAAGLPMQGQRDGRDRIRNVWESFRDRLGLNARNTGLPSAHVPANDSLQEGPADGEARMRPGELMLAEMARALNIGLGLNGDGTPVSGRSSEQTGSDASAQGGAVPATGADGDRTMPPEDSFERFLINLQADLRVALSEDTSGGSESGDLLPPRPADEDASSPPNESAPAPTDADLDEDEAGPAREGMDDEPHTAASVSGGSDTEYDEDGEDDEELAEGDGADNTDRTHAHAARTPTPIPASGLPFGADQRPSQRDSERRPPGINLWRLYRFQPIPASYTQAQTHAAGTSRAASPNTDASASQPEGAGTLPSLHSPSASFASDPQHDESEADLDSSPSSAPSAQPTEQHAHNANVVVPVIVVGLQSVDMTRPHDHDHDDPMMAPDDMRGSESGSSDEQHGAADGHLGTSPPARGRTWQSRAANALRTLRPGRRGGSRGRQSGEGTGSRTFLIYVIGGYYPPNHHMVTGSDSLDSYEALWELAELLGQVKPPVATREDIDNSGLQIITRDELTHYEKEGRVSSNCTERCLICLDDYEDDDNLRLMSCKHAFHKKCVDKWLQVGRNNCPACRTRGVSTPGDSNS